MGFFDFLKRKDKVQKSDEGKEKVSLLEILPWIEKKENEVEMKNRQIFILLNDKRRAIIDSLTEKINALENVDVDSKKADDKIKLVVKENLANYVYYARDFLKKLLNLEMGGVEKFVSNVDNLLLELDKRSNVSYQKANVLIGKEITSVKEELKNFSNFLIDVLNENKDHIDYSRTINTIKLQFHQLRKSEENIHRIDIEIRRIDNRIKETKENQQELQIAVDRVKETREYEENAEKRERIQVARMELEAKISKLREAVNFKALNNVFHVNEKRMRIVNDFKENFSSEFRKDNGETLLMLLEEANLNEKTILNKINEIRTLEREIIRERENLRGDGVQGLVEGITQMNSEIDSLVNEKIAEKKRQEKLSENNVRIIDEIKGQMNKLDVLLTG
jgi:hypothetical protein